jgi:type II secretory pathway component PulL
MGACSKGIEEKTHTRDQCTTREAAVSLKVVEKVLSAYAQMGVPSEPASKQVCIVDATSQLPHTQSLLFSQKFFADEETERDVFRVLCCFSLAFLSFSVFSYTVGA